MAATRKQQESGAWEGVHVLQRFFAGGHGLTLAILRPFTTGRFLYKVL